MTKKIKILIPILLFLAFGLRAANLDTLNFDIKAVACKPSDGDCEFIKWQYRLENISIDSIQKTYPLYVVIFTNVKKPSGFALSPSIYIGNHKLRESGSHKEGIFFKVYTDSLFKSFAGRIVTILPAYQKDPVQRSIFPEVRFVDSIVAQAKQNVSSLPEFREAFNPETSIKSYWIPSDLSPTAQTNSHLNANTISLYNLSGKRICSKRTSGLFIAGKNRFKTILKFTR